MDTDVNLDFFIMYGVIKYEDACVSSNLIFKILLLAIEGVALFVCITVEVTVNFLSLFLCYIKKIK